MVVEEGKMFYLDLVGQTLPSPTQNGQSALTFDISGDASTRNPTSQIGFGLPQSQPLSPQPSIGDSSSKSFGENILYHITANTGSKYRACIFVLLSNAFQSAEVIFVEGSLKGENSKIADILLVVPSALEGQLHLKDVPIGLDAKQAPRQRTQLVNVSGVDTLYDVDLYDLEMFKTHNFDQPLIKVFESILLQMPTISLTMLIKM
jgi:hypothetical protein